MRLSVGDAILVFNGKDGEWQTEIEAGNKKSATLKCIHKTKASKSRQMFGCCLRPLKGTDRFHRGKGHRIRCRRIFSDFNRLHQF